MKETWTDAWGRSWAVATILGRLKFQKCPSHAALRVHVFHRDGYRCVCCGLEAAEVPAGYDGRQPLRTVVILRGFPVLLVLDHILARKAGGTHRVDNLQTLCEVCNLRKISEDMAAARAYRRGEVR